jgi:hypothetical protein
MKAALSLILALSMSLGASAEPAKPDAAALRALHDRALEAHSKGDRKGAAALLFDWLQAAPRTAEAYDAAQHVLAEDLQKLGLTHAALLFESAVVKTRARPELLPEALERIDAWTSGAPHDEERFERELLAGQDFGALEGKARAFVAYQQGAADLKAGNPRWAEARFNELPESSPFRARARLLSAGVQLARGEDAQAALAVLEELSESAPAPREVRNDARIAAARLRFEAGEHAAALKLYQSVELPELDPGRGQLYLESAWAHYRAGEGGRAMGLLAALDAPSFRHLFLPDKYLLRALIYKDACHWLAAKRGARSLLRRYAGALSAIHERRALVEDAQLAEAALQKGFARRSAQLVEELDREREKLTRLSSALGDGLTARLGELYSAEQAEARRRLQLELEKGVVKVADELLRAAEQVSLIDYEVSLALYRRAHGSGPQSPLVFQEVAAGKDEVAFGFDGEYWNDELLGLRFALPDRCSEGVAP